LPSAQAEEDKSAVESVKKRKKTAMRGGFCSFFARKGSEKARFDDKY